MCCGSARCVWIATRMRCLCALKPSGRASATKVTGVVFSGNWKTDGSATVIAERTFAPEKVYGSEKKPMSRLKLGIPKGSLQDATLDLFSRAGWKITLGSRSYVPTIDDPEIECLLVRAQEMARYVETGALDAGITGHDWVVETGATVDELSELVYAKQRLARVRWVLAVPEDSAIREPRDLEGKSLPPRLCTSRKAISPATA